MAKMSSAELKVFIQIKDCTKRAVFDCAVEGSSKLVGRSKEVAPAFFGL
jgi:hypothetical protein